jgi:hypothetical protein
VTESSDQRTLPEAENDAGRRSDESRSPNRITLATLLVVVAAIGAECAVVVQIRTCYEAVPAYATPACPEWQATPLVLTWIVLGSLAVFAIRKSTALRLAIQVAISCALVLTRISVPTRTGVFGGAYDAFWPAACFGVCFVLPYILVRYTRINNAVLILADSAAVALLVHIFALYHVPRL